MLHNQDRIFIECACCTESIDSRNLREWYYWRKKKKKLFIGFCQRYTRQEQTTLCPVPPPPNLSWFFVKFFCHLDAWTEIYLSTNIFQSLQPGSTRLGRLTYHVTGFNFLCFVQSKCLSFICLFSASLNCLAACKWVKESVNWTPVISVVLCYTLLEKKTRIVAENIQKSSSP